MPSEQLAIPVSAEGTVSALRTEPDGSPSTRLFVYAPGAGSNMNDPFGAYATYRLAAEGFTGVRFQFPYMEAGRRRPDRTPVLEDTWRRVLDAVRAPDLRLTVGGRSMGGRIASQVVAQGVDVDALALFAYPLHPPGKPDQRRDAHLPDIDVPTLFCSGTGRLRDARGATGRGRLRAAGPRLRPGWRKPRLLGPQVQRQDAPGRLGRGGRCDARVAGRR